MRTYILVSFWLGVIGLGCRAAFLSFADYPRAARTSRFEEVCFLFIGSACILWAFRLVWP